MDGFDCTEACGSQEWVFTWYGWPNSTKAQNWTGQRQVSEMLNEVGRDSWRLVESTVLETAVVSGDSYGLPEVGTPVSIRWTFMREVST